MPLFLFVCTECGHEKEMFFHKPPEEEVLCEECGELCERQFSNVRARKIQGAKEALHEKILPDADRIKKNIQKGKNKDFLDLYGEK